MNLKKSLIISLLSTTVLANAFTYSADAAEPEEVADQKDETQTTIEIIDNDDGSGTDPLEPTDPNQKNLTLEHVPGNYDFETKLAMDEYSLDATLEDSVDVFNDRVDRQWDVKAEVADNELSLERDEAYKLEVSSFKINETELVGTSESGIVAEAAESKTKENNTGLIKTSVSDVSIKFTDHDNELIAGDILDGTINYQLYYTREAE